MQKRVAVGVALVIVAAWSATAVAQTDQHGVSHDLAQPGRVTVVDFAAAWCVPCWSSLPRLEALAARHPDVGFLVISVDDRVDGRDQLVSKLALTLPVIWDADHVIAERFEPQAMPATFVLDARGAIVYQHLGYDQDSWAAFVDFLDGL
ncbi:MAG: TlpA disulfide reductase family protein [Vicinamibacterales bacterium]|nr:TlpA disulfide reductase family protein [Vicinamibacterales bacterium]